MNTINYVLAIVTFDGQTKYLDDKNKTGGEGFTTNQHFVKKKRQGMKQNTLLILSMYWANGYLFTFSINIILTYIY